MVLVRPIGYSWADMVVLVNKRAVVVWLSVLVATMGCQPKVSSPLPASALPEGRPTARVVSLGVQGAQLDYATLRFEVEVNNPSGVALSVVGLRYGLTSGANMFFSAAPIPRATVSPKATELISFTHQIVYERLLRALAIRPGSTVPFTLEARLLVTAGRKGVQVPLSSEGPLFLPLPSRSDTGNDNARTVDVIYIPTPQDVVEKMLSMAEVMRDDLVYDLGCGDGRIVVTAARKYGCHAVGYDIDPRRVEESRASVSQNGLGSLVQIEQKDVFTVDLTPARVVAFYLNPVVNRRLIPQLQMLKPGSRVVSHSFPVGDVKPAQVVTMTSREDGQEHVIYLYGAPLKMD